MSTMNLNDAVIHHTLEDKKKTEEKLSKILIPKPDSPDEKRKKEEKELSKKR